MRFILLILFLFAALAKPCLASEPSPDSNFVLEPSCTFTAKDGSFSIRQYHNPKDNWQIWMVPRHGAAYQLTDEDPVYPYRSGDDPGNWNLSPDSHWLARTERLGSGTYTLLLYHREGNQRFTQVSPGPLGDLACNFYEKHSGLTREQCLVDHPQSTFFKWVGSRYLVVALSGESTMSTPMWATNNWLVEYDLKERRFFLTDDLIDKNQGRVYPVVQPVSEPLDTLR